jgi:hypothetical protein
MSPEQLNALAAFLASQKSGGQQEQPAADYASSMTWDDNRGKWANALGNGLLGVGAIGSGFLPGVGLPGAAAGSISGSMMLGKAMGNWSDYQQSKTGAHPDQAEMDEYLRLMQYYGQSPKMGPR